MKVLDFLVCDDIRAEVGNKFSVMGCYTEGMQIQSVAPWPIPIRFCVFFRFQLDQDDAAPESVALTIAQNGVFLSTSVNPAIILDRTRPITFISGPLQFLLPAPGELIFSFECKVRDRSVLGESLAFPVQLATPPTGAQAFGAVQ